MTDKFMLTIFSHFSLCCVSIDFLIIHFNTNVVFFFKHLSKLILSIKLQTKNAIDYTTAH